MKVAFQGVHGAYSDLASQEMFAGCKTIPKNTFEAVFEAVDEAQVDFGVIPVENSLAGSIHLNYDLLVQHGLHIIGETYLRVEHALLCHRSTNLRNIKSVRSHPQALAQCSHFFAKNKSIKPEVYFDTAGAALSLAKEAPKQIAAIASIYAGTLYNLKPIKRNLQNKRDNFTRFLAISPKPGRVKNEVKWKSSITFIPPKNESGALFKVLGVFADKHIDLTKIESRPDPEKPFDYRFYLDLAGSTKETAILSALKMLKPMVKNLRVLGSYPRANVPKK